MPVAVMILFVLECVEIDERRAARLDGKAGERARAAGCDAIAERVHSVVDGIPHDILAVLVAVVET
jgi:hypothetical protein